MTDIDLDVTCFDNSETEALLHSALDEAENPKHELQEDDIDAEQAVANIKEPVTKPGDMWLVRSAPATLRGYDKFPGCSAAYGR